MKDKFFETASFHIVKPCNMKCKFCYATFQDMKVISQLSLSDACNIMDKLKDAGLEKITFAGGEPMLYKWIREIIIYSKKIGLTTSIITNGSLLTHQFMIDMKGHLDWIGISIDSLSLYTNELIGRRSTMKMDYRGLIENIKLYGYRLKINTVVNRYNVHKNQNDFIEWAAPERWKVFQALKVEEQNDSQFDEVKVSSEEFNSFIERHKHQKSLVPESNEDMIGGYLLIDPQGRLFEDTKGIHTYSDKLQHNDIEHCLNQINLKREVFVRRGGIYSWA